MIGKTKPNLTEHLNFKGSNKNNLIPFPVVPLLIPKRPFKTMDSHNQFYINVNTSYKKTSKPLSNKDANEIQIIGNVDEECNTLKIDGSCMKIESETTSSSSLTFCPQNDINIMKSTQNFKTKQSNINSLAPTHIRNKLQTRTKTIKMVKNDGQNDFLLKDSINLRGNNDRKRRLTEKKIQLPFKIAILIHIYHNKDINNRVLKSMLPFLDHYEDSSFYFYINIIGTSNAPYLNELVHKVIGSRTKNLEIYNSFNQGGDIGSFLLLSEKMLTSGQEFKYMMFFHTKSNHIWRTSMIKALSNLKLERLSEYPELGLIGSSDYLHDFHYTHNNNYESHFQTISKTLGVQLPITDGEKFQFVAGTIFLLNIQVMRGLDPNRLLELYAKLNTVNTVDLNWHDKMKIFKKNPKGANNDYHYRHLYGKSLHSDFMIEHSIERFIGILVKMANLKAYGVSSFFKIRDDKAYS